MTNQRDTSLDEQALRCCIEPINQPDIRAALYRIVDRLKQTDGESWAAGETLRRLGQFMAADNPSTSMKTRAHKGATPVPLVEELAGALESLARQWHAVVHKEEYATCGIHLCQERQALLRRVRLEKSTAIPPIGGNSGCACACHTLEQTARALEHYGEKDVAAHILSNIPSCSCACHDKGPIQPGCSACEASPFHEQVKTRYRALTGSL